MSWESRSWPSSFWRGAVLDFAHCSHHVEAIFWWNEFKVNLNPSFRLSKNTRNKTSWSWGKFPSFPLWNCYLNCCKSSNFPPINRCFWQLRWWWRLMRPNYKIWSPGCHPAAFFPAFSRHLPIFSTCSHHFLEFPSHFPNIVPAFSFISPKFVQHFPILSPWFSQASHQLPACRPRSRGRSPAPKSRAKSPRPRARPSRRTWNHPGGREFEWDYEIMGYPLVI